MRKAEIKFSGTLVVYEDGYEWNGGEMTGDDVRGWVRHALTRGDKHAGNYCLALDEVVSVARVGDDE